MNLACDFPLMKGGAKEGRISVLLFARSSLVRRGETTRWPFQSRRLIDTLFMGVDDLGLTSTCSDVLINSFPVTDVKGNGYAYLS